MAYNPFKKLDELKYGTSSGTTATGAYNPNNYSSLISSKQNTTTKPAGPGYGYAGATDAFKPTTVPKVTTTTPSYLQTGETLAEKQRKQNEERLGRAKEYNTQSYDERNRLLKESIPMLQNQFSQTQGYFDKAMVGATDKANLAKSNIEDTAGSTQRQNAETLRTGQAGISNRFAGLNTSDSYGAGSHMQAQENVQSDFNRLTAENLKQKSNQLAEVESNLQTYQLDAQRQLDGLKATLDNTILQIQSNMRMNDLDKQKAIDSAVYDYEDSLNTIDTTLNNMYKDYQLKALELEKTGLSKGFMTTGKPENENDYKFLVENSEKYDKYGAIIGTGGTGTTKPTNEGKALQMVNNLIDGNYQAVSGTFRTPGFAASMVPGAGAARADMEGLRSLLALAERGQLKGSGAVSDFESKMLEKAALAGLTSELPEAEFLSRLKLLQSDLKSGGAVDNRQQENSVSALKAAGFSDQEIQEYLGGI